MDSEDSDYEINVEKLPKIQKTEVGTCVICNNASVPIKNLTKPKDISSWEVLLNAAKIRNFKPILECEVNEDAPVPNIWYERRCRNEFVHKKSLEKIHRSSTADEGSSDQKPELRRTTRRDDGNERQSIVYPAKCIFCEKYNKYVKGTHTREKLTQCIDLRADATIRETATRMLSLKRTVEEEMLDKRILAFTSRDIVAAEAHYHKSCYIDYTRKRPICDMQLDADQESSAYGKAESEAYTMLFDYIRANLIGRPHVARMTDITAKLVAYMHSIGVTDIKPQTKKHIRRKLETEFGSSLTIFPTQNGKLLIMPDNLSKEQLAQDYINIREKLDMITTNENVNDKTLSTAAVYLRKKIKESHKEKSWPPCPSELDSNYTEIPSPLKSFLTILLSGQRQNSTRRVARLVWSISQDLMYGATFGQMNTSKHILLAWAVKTLTGNVEIITMLNRLGHGISYTKLEEIDTALAIQKLQTYKENVVVLPSDVQYRIPTVLAFDNIDRLEETLSGSGTSHRVNGIIVQPQVSTVALQHPNLSKVAKDKKRSLVMVPTSFPLHHHDSNDRKCPPAIAPRESSIEEIKEEKIASRKNITWCLIRQCNAINQTVSSWTGFNILTSNGQYVQKDTVGYLPTINAPATSMSTVQEIIHQIRNIRTTLDIPEIVCVFDQALYAKAAEIVWNYPEECSGIILRMGTFHTICNLLSIMGKRFRDAGLRDLAVEAGVIAEGSINSVLDGRQYNRGVRLHKIVYEALIRLTWKGFQVWMEKNTEGIFEDLQSLIEHFEEVGLNPDNASLSTLLEEKSCITILDLFDQYQNLLRNDKGPLAAFWMSYLDMVEIMLNLIRASREGNFPLHLQATRSMIPWCFAYDKQNYARYLCIYHAQMSKLPEEHEFTYQHMLNGGFSVQLNTNNAFARIPVDQTLEETINKDTQTAGGTKGFSLKPTTVSKYYMTAEYRSVCLRQLRNLISMAAHSERHPDLSKTRILRDERDVQSVLDLLENNWVNPFDFNQFELISISSGIAASMDVKNDLLTAYDHGKAAYHSFVELRLKNGSGFYDKIPRQNLKTFTSLQTKRKSITLSNKETILKADHHIFGRMLLIALTRKLNMEEVFKHPLGPLPWSLANCDGTIKKTNKAALRRHLEKQVSSEDHIRSPSACIIDAMALIQKMNGDNITFADLSEHLLIAALRSNPQSNRIDIVFDIYNDVSIKNSERMKRGADVGLEILNIIPTRRIQNWRRILSCSATKEKLTHYFAEDWQKRQSLIGNREVYVTLKEKCIRIRKDTVEEIAALKCTHEEADTRLLLHAKHAADCGFASVILIAEDTDVLILCLAFSWEIACDIFMRFGNRKTGTKHVDVKKIAANIEKGVCKALLGFHAFSGCDSVSAFSGQGKLKGLKLIQQNQSFQVAFSTLGSDWRLSDELFQVLQAFVCKLYARSTTINKVDELRYQLWRAKKGIVQSGQLPPCRDSLYQHSLRANYQSGLWRRCLESSPHIPFPENDHGWILGHDGGLYIQWITGPLAPDVILEFISCKCSRKCEAPTCQCVSSGLQCTEECRLQNCSNMHDFNEPLQLDSDDDSDSEFD